jgi:tRNA modification GTPase
MSYDPHDTICAGATAAGGAARGIVRVSGADAADIVSRLFSSVGGVQLRDLTRATVVSGQIRLNGPAASPAEEREVTLACELFIWPTSRSYTREPVAELHTLGSPPLLDAVVAALCQSGARLAEPGEFTLRAFLAGRIDLTQAEAVLGVIDAHGDAELSAALAQLAGGLARPLQLLRDNLLQLLAELEAGLDFVDEDIEFISNDELRTRLRLVGGSLARVAQQMTSRGTSGPAAQIVLTGRPNVGKSSLFNALVERFGHRTNAYQARLRPAIVSPRAGTTRDYLTATIDVHGIRCELVDTAGFDGADTRDSFSGSAEDVRQNAGINSDARRLAAERRDAATIRLHCVEASNACSDDVTETPGNDVLVLTKCDVSPPPSEARNAATCTTGAIATSSRTGEGLQQLATAIHRRLHEESRQSKQVVAATIHRCRESLRIAHTAIEQASELADAGQGHELIAAEIRVALAELGKVVGAVYTEDVLDRIFSTFCIGK